MSDLYIASRSDLTDCVKIGKSSNTLSRCNQLQRGHCFRITVEAILENKGDREKSVHKALREYQIGNSEWFRTDLQTVLETIEEAEPMPKTRRHYNGEAIAQRNLQTGKTMKSTRYPFLQAQV